MESTGPQNRRIPALVGIFLFMLFSGVASMWLWGGSTGNFFNDLYLVLGLFALEGDWVFEGQANSYLKVLVFAAPVFTVLGVIELFTRKLIQKLVTRWRLVWIKKHVIIIGLTEESILLIASLRKSSGRQKVAVLDSAPKRALEKECRRLGAPVIEGNPASASMLSFAKPWRANCVVSFLDDSSQTLQVIFATNEALAGKPEAVDLWLKLDSPEFGRRLGEYFKFTGLSHRVHPRFFNLDELAARRLVRIHPPDVYADAFGQDVIHIAIYGFEGVAFQVIEEAILQHATKSEAKPKVTVLSPDPEAVRTELAALLPQIETVADLDVRQMQFYSTGISDEDYGIIPEGVTMHVVCKREADTAAAIALSLRKLLLTPPPGKKLSFQRRLNAPIFVRLERSLGIGQLLRTNIKSSDFKKYLAETSNNDETGEIPDGLFPFGMIEELLSADQGNSMVPTVVDAQREQIARYLHYSYTYDRKTLAKLFGPSQSGRTQAEREWESLAPEFRESCRQGADHLWTKARVLRHRLVRKKPGEKNTVLKLSPEENRLVAIIEHRRWVTERLLAGWAYDPKRVDAAHRHNLLRPWEELSKREEKLDLGLGERMGDAVKPAGLQLKKELVIGVIGHRLAPDRPFDEAHVRAALEKNIKKLIKDNPGRAPVILTPLADGADTVAAEIAIKWKLPIVAPLPLPFEVYRQDFFVNGPDHVEKFLNLIAVCERYIELPLKFGSLVEVAWEPEGAPMSEARKKQYALAGAYIVERADELIAVWDGKKARGIGGTAEIISWRKRGAVPKAYRTADKFYERPAIKPPIILPPTP